MGQIKAGLNELEYDADAKEIGLDHVALKGKLSIFVAAEKLPNSQLDMSVTIKGIMKLGCDRCLETFEKEFENSFELVYIEQSRGEEIESDDYIRPYSPFMRYIDITGDIKDYVELSVPMRKVPDEKKDGSCSWCRKKKEYWDSLITNVVENDE